MVMLHCTERAQLEPGNVHAFATMTGVMTGVMTDFITGLVSGFMTVMRRTMQLLALFALGLWVASSARGFQSPR